MPVVWQNLLLAAALAPRLSAHCKWSPRSLCHHSWHSRHAPACHFLDGKTGEAAEDKGRGRNGGGRSRPQVRVCYHALMSGRHSLDKLRSGIFLHLEGVASGMADYVEISIARLNGCGCVLEKVFDDLSNHLVKFLDCRD
ncbi:hypothetical protein B0T25DRAFT_560186 [Lasiosphaeria hispida]|uniref:Secreted protein n=1 Tax=Lasiosphaeria hispida TaxID=260671 RepID=A0AAJ0H8A9_9PEZI|nr:hypothetical protein B0T25DRAFT_560186 [Lasiosphaeria hispida]